ncbi:hypothetical protein BHC44_06705 [Snodgrassella alvi]|nr:hypothetical protein BHC44_06705 [Snodgrassella alvi]
MQSPHHQRHSLSGAAIPNSTNGHCARSHTGATDLPKNQLEMECQQPIMHNVTIYFIKFYSLRPMNYQLNNFAAYPATEHSASKPPLSTFVGIVRHDNLFGTPLFGYNLERPLKKRLHHRLTLKFFLEAEFNQGNVHL